MKDEKKRRLSVAIFAFYFSWLLAFLFEGRVFYALASRYQVDAYGMVFAALVSHFAGLALCGFFIHSILVARKFLMGSILFCIMGSFLFFFPPSILWQIGLSVMAFITGGAVSAWGYYYKRFTLPGDRLGTAAEGLIYSNLLMIVINMITSLFFDYAGFILSICMLLVAFFLVIRLPVESNMEGQYGIPELSTGINDRKTQGGFLESSKKYLYRSLFLLYLFIMIITVNSGLMYQVITPAFLHHKILVSWYWAVPYIVSLYLMKSFLYKRNRAYFLYIAIAMIGFCFIFFMVLDRSAISFLVVNTLMLGAYGIYDLFWWSILGEMIELEDNPARMLGIGLSANVLGVLSGGILGRTITTLGIPLHYITLLAFGMILITFMLLPLLHKELSSILKNHIYLSLGEKRQSDFIRENPSIDRNGEEGKKNEQQNEITNEMLSKLPLTEREIQIVSLLCNGRTYKMIAEELFLSENTIKTHIKNIYSKLNITSKTELIHLISTK